MLCFETLFQLCSRLCNGFSVLASETSSLAIRYWATSTGYRIRERKNDDCDTTLKTQILSTPFKPARSQAFISLSPYGAGVSPSASTSP